MVGVLVGKPWVVEIVDFLHKGRIRENRDRVYFDGGEAVTHEIPGFPVVAKRNIGNVTLVIGAVLIVCSGFDSCPWSKEFWNSVL